MARASRCWVLQSDTFTSSRWSRYRWSRSRLPSRSRAAAAFRDRATAATAAASLAQPHTKTVCSLEAPRSSNLGPNPLARTYGKATAAPRTASGGHKTLLKASLKPRRASPWRCIRLRWPARRLRAAAGGESSVGCLGASSPSALAHPRRQRSESRSSSSPTAQSW